MSEVLVDEQALAAMVEDSEMGAGLAKVRVNGMMQVVAIEIDDLLFKESKTVTQDLLVAALNQGLSRMTKRVAEKIRKTIREKLVPTGKIVSTSAAEMAMSVDAELSAVGRAVGVVDVGDLQECLFCSHLAALGCSLCGGVSCVCDPCVRQHGLKCAGALRPVVGGRYA